LAAIVAGYFALSGREEPTTVARQESAPVATPPKPVAPAPESALPRTDAATLRPSTPNTKSADGLAKPAAVPPTPPEVEQPPKAPEQRVPPPSAAVTPPTESPPKEASSAQPASPAAAVEPAPRPARPPAAPAVAADERRWAAIKDSDKIADFFGFQLKYPNSPRSRDAAARIDALEQRRQQDSRSDAVAGTQGATGTPVDRARPAATELPPRVAAANASTKAAVRIRVRGFGYVYVDGVLIGASPPVQTVEVGPGRHRIEARNPEARPPIVSTEIDVTGTQARDVQLRFSE
jgi:hypothetical protein